MNGYLYHHQRSLRNVDATMVMMMIDTSLKHTSDVVGRILQSINLGGNCSTKIYWIHDEKRNENGEKRKEAESLVLQSRENSRATEYKNDISNDLCRRRVVP
jgi:hypothetical protein